MSKSEVLKAPDIIKNPDIVDKIETKYQIIEALSTSKLNQAINIMAQKGWKCINITGCLTSIPRIGALMEKTT